MKAKLISYCLALLLVLMCFVPYEWSHAAITSVGSASYATSQTQNNDALQDEQIKVAARGSILTINGRTQLAPLECSTGEVPIYVTSFKNMSDKSFGAPYIEMNPSEEIGQNGETVYVFNGRYDFSDVANGTYLMYLWRGKIGTDYKYDFGSSWGKGILSYDTVIKVYTSDGKKCVRILRYNNIISENQKVDAAMNAEGTDDFLNTSLKDMFFVNRDPQVSGDRGKALTDSQISYIQAQAEAITANCTTDYQKIKAIYEYTAEHLYYDEVRNNNGGAYANPYYNLYNIINKENNGYNSSNGRVATVCTGYAAMVVSMARTLGIPTRLVNGKHPAIENTQWTNVTDLNEENHHWAECYVDGRWIMVDATMGTQNEYNANTKKWTYTGVSNYTYFDPTDEQVAVHYLKHGIYRVADPVITDVPSLKTANRGLESIKVSWGAMQGAEGATGYYVQCLSSSGEHLAGAHISNLNTYSYTFDNLAAGKNYTIRVCGYGIANEDKTYGPYTTINTCTMPNIISGITSTQTASTVKVKWNPSRAKGYHIRIYDQSTGELIAGTHTLNNYYTFTGLTSAKYYTIKIRPYMMPAGTKIYNSSSTATTCTLPVKVSKISTTKYTTSIKATWSKSPRASGYYIQLLNENGSIHTQKYTTGTTYTFKGLNPCRTYKVRVKPYKTWNGYKKYGSYYTLTTGTVPNKVIIKAPATGSTHYVTAKWGKRTCDGYQVMLATNSKFTKGTKAYYVSKNISSKKITNLKKGTYYYVKVRAYNEINGKKYCGSWSAYKMIKCK